MAAGSRARCATARGPASRTCRCNSRAGRPTTPRASKSDPSGRFDLQGVPAGTIQITADLDLREGFELEERVELENGESAHVVLEPSASPVRVHGRILLGDEPLAKAQLNLRKRGEDGGSATARCDDTGTYEVVVDGPGRYRLEVSRGMGMFLRSAVEIPPVEDFAFDVVFAAGRISGTVRDDDGRPVDGVWVDAELVERERVEEQRAKNQVATGEDGRYELAVPAGAYTVRAGGNSWQSTLDGRSFVAARVEDVEVRTGAHVRGIDLVLARGGVLRGVVKPADGGGRTGLWLAPAGGGGEARGLGGIDGDGRFRVAGVPRGSWLVAARSELMLSEWMPVEVEPGAEREVELELTPATSLLLRVREADGPSTEATVRVTEANGTSHLGRLDHDVYWAGPFHPGRYRVRAERDGRATERTVEIAGGEEQMELELVLVLE